jgi:hypothetical protein
MTARKMSTLKHVLRIAVRFARNARRNGRLAPEEETHSCPVLVPPFIVGHKNSVTGIPAAANRFGETQGSSRLTDSPSPSEQPQFLWRFHQTWASECVERLAQIDLATRYAD